MWPGTHIRRSFDVLPDKRRLLDLELGDRFQRLAPKVTVLVPPRVKPLLQPQGIPGTLARVEQLGHVVPTSVPFIGALFGHAVHFIFHQSSSPGRTTISSNPVP